MDDTQTVAEQSPGPIALVTGSLPEIEAALLERIARAKAEDPFAAVDVVVGSVLLRPYLQRLVAEHGAGLLNVRFSTLGELGVRLGERALIDAGRRPLPAMAARGYAAEVARVTNGYFGPVAHTPGFAEAVRQLMRELQQEDVSLDRLDELAAGAVESGDKAAGLTDIYRRYLEGRRDWYDGNDALAVADAAVLESSELVLYGVWRLGEHARHMIRQIAECVPVTVVLPVAGGDPDLAHRALREWLHDLDATHSSVSPAATRRTALAHLQQTLFAPTDEATPDGTVRLVSAPEPLSEVREVARSCLDWAREGISFREMAITYRDASTYRPLVEAVFSDAGIPIYLDDGPSIAERPLGRRMLALLDLVDSSLRRRDVLAFLTDGWLPKTTRARYGDVPVARWESATRRAGVVEGIGQWRARVGALIERERTAATRDGAPEWLAERVVEAESLLAFIEDFARLLADYPTHGTWTECLAALRRLVEELVDGSEEVLGHLDQLARLDDLTGPVEYGRFLDVVRAEIHGLKAGDLEGGNQGAFGLRGVNVLDVNALRHLRFRAVAVLGLTERAFPPPPRQDPLLLDDERDALNRTGGLTIPLRARGDDLEPLQFAVATQAAGERLLLSTRRAQEAGARSQIPSSFFREAASTLAGHRLDAGELSTLDPGFYSLLRAGKLGPDDPDRALTVEERDIAVLETDPPLGTALLHELAPVAVRADLHRRARWATRTLTPFDGVFEHPDAIAALDAWLEGTSPLSPSVLETYAICPYRFFLERLLGVKPLEEPETIIELDPLTRGSVIHEVLEQFLGSHTPDDLRTVPAATLQERLREIAEHALAEVEAAGLAGAPVTWTRERTEIVDDLARWLEREIADPGGYPRREFEVAFGGLWSGRDESPLSTDEPLALDVARRTVRLRGRIDRVEWEPSGTFRIIDYKTGRNRLKGVFDGGRALQLALYLLAASKLLEIDVANGVASYEFPTRRGDFGSHQLDGRALDTQRDALDTVLGRIVGGIIDGDFHHEPGKETCRFCNFQALCDVRRQRIAERKNDDARRLSFSEMREVE